MIVLQDTKTIDPSIRLVQLVGGKTSPKGDSEVNNTVLCKLYIKLYSALTHQV